MCTLNNLLHYFLIKFVVLYDKDKFEEFLLQQWHVQKTQLLPNFKHSPISRSS